MHQTVSAVNEKVKVIKQQTLNLTFWKRLHASRLIWRQGWDETILYLEASSKTMAKIVRKW